MIRTACTALLLSLALPAMASPRCWLGLSKCVPVQGEQVPIDTAERMADDCADFTRRHAGARAVKMTTHEILQRYERNPRDPIATAYFAYDRLHDSPLKFDRSLPYEQRYRPVFRACGQVFRDLRIAPPSEDEDQ